MAGVTGIVSAKVVSKLKSKSDGVNLRIAAIGQDFIDGSLQPIKEISGLNANVETTERGGHTKYPSMHVYCDKLTNNMREKFRTFSGRASVVIEVRHSQDQLLCLDERVQAYADAICALLDDSRGDWADGTFYAGGYEVVYDAIARGGKNFLQRAKVKFEVEVSR